MEEKRQRVNPTEDHFPYKVELHVHLDGAIRLSTLFDLSRRRNIDLQANDPNEFRKLFCVYHSTSFFKVLAAFTNYMPVVVGNREAISRLAYEFCEDCAKNGIRYVEARFCPQLLANKEKHEYALEQGDLSPQEVVRLVVDAFQRGSADFKIRAKLILCCMRHRPDWSDEVVELAREFRQDGVVAIDIAGGNKDEADVEFIHEKHKMAFKKAKEYGIHITAHAGEVGPAAKVRESLDDLHAERIGQGYRCLEDDELYRELLERKIHMETCPLSSICTGSVSEDMQHPIVSFANDGANFSLNSDDPLVFDSCLLDDYQEALEMGLTQDQIIQSIFNAARSSFTTDEEKQTILQELAEEYGQKYLNA